MVGPWPHPPGTLRALMTILQGPFHIICRPCKRYAPMAVAREDLDRPYEPCPYVCRQCGARAEIVTDVPAAFALTTPVQRKPKPQPSEPAPTRPPTAWHRPNF